MIAENDITSLSTDRRQMAGLKAFHNASLRNTGSFHENQILMPISTHSLRQVKVMVSIGPPQAQF